MLIGYLLKAEAWSKCNEEVAIPTIVTLIWTVFALISTMEHIDINGVNEQRCRTHEQSRPFHVRRAFRIFVI